MNTMVWSALVTVLMLLHGAQCLEQDNKGSLHSDAVDLPWQDELCCDSPSAHHSSKDRDAELSDLPQRCLFRRSANENHPSEDAGGTCMDILCRIDEDWTNITCDLQSRRVDAGPMVVSLQMLSQTDSEAFGPAQDNFVVCEAQHSFKCSLAINTNGSFVATVTVGLPDAKAPPVRLRIPARPMKPNPPVHLSHIQTIEPGLIVQWDDPPGVPGPLTYEVRHTDNITHPDWQLSASPEPRLSLELTSVLNYIVQVRCSRLIQPRLWSDWSEPHHIDLYTVSYIPKNVVARPGENVTVYCVFNDHSINASMAMWMLNFKEPLYHSQPVSQWVSQITVRPSETQMYETLQCTQEWSIPYSQIDVQGALINISCETNGDVDAMECRQTSNSTLQTKSRFQSKWADLPCDVMEEKERMGEDVGEQGPACAPLRSKPKTCIIQPLRMNCYKLWLEVASPLGPIRSRPVYLSPTDHVKPHPPTNVRAITQSSGVLTVTWEPPPLPAEGLKCQTQYSLYSKREWKLLSPVWAQRIEVSVPDMCRVYVVQVRCMHTDGIGYWSEWSHSVTSTPQSDRAPERGPDFWRVREKQPLGKQTNVTLLFEHLSIPGNSYCVDGFVVQRRTSDGSVIPEKIRRSLSYSFEWDQEPNTVTVEAYNSEGSSTDNMNMTLQRKPKYPSVRSFHVSVVNSTCVSLSWSLWSNSSKPLYMVVQWVSAQRNQDELSEPRGKTWSRIPYTEQTVYLRGHFFASEDFGFYLYAVFADGEAEPIYTLATREDPAIYLMLMIVSIVSIALFIMAIFSQNQVKRLVWKDIPNPRMCSWAKGVDFKKADTFDHLLQAPEGLPVWPLLLPAERISKVIIMDQTKTMAPSTLLGLTPDLVSDEAISVSSALRPELVQFTERESQLHGALSSMSALTETAETHLEVLPAQHHPRSAASSAQSCVTYATVLHSDPKHHQECIQLDDKEGSGSSSSDEGNFSANNSDLSGSFPCGLWELESCRDGDMDDPRHSCSYNSVEELSETSEHEDEAEGVYGNDLYYLGTDYPAEDEHSDEDGGQPGEASFTRSRSSSEVAVEAHPLLSCCGSSEQPPLYLPQFRTALHKMQLTGSHRQDNSQL